RIVGRLLPSASILVLVFPVGWSGNDTSFGADPGAQQYDKVVSAEPDLAAYWPFEGDLKDAKGKADGRPQGGRPQFGDGPGGGDALVLAGGRFVTMGNTPELDLKETTVELWFQPNFQSGVQYNPSIIAKRGEGDHRFTRFSIHVQNDYSRLAVWNGQSVTHYQPPGGPLRKGEWYHLAVSCNRREMQLYLDGVPCGVEGGRGRFNFGRANLPLSIGSSTPNGQELLDCRIDEVAIYRRVLSEAEIARHVDAMGWKKR
ncbi:unnamed protein product, partial [marine sediment metagenome]